jgi:hypothetical protein
MEESWKKIVEMEKMLETLLNEADFIIRKQEKKILYDYIANENIFSQNIWLRHPKTLPVKFPIETKETKLEREKYLPEMLKYIRNCTNKVYFLIGGRLKMLMNRWRPLGASVLVLKGIMARYKNRAKAMKKLQERKTYSEFQRTSRLQKIFDEQMSDWIKNGVLKETPYEDLIYINPAHLVPKANGKMKLVTNMCVVNSCMQDIHFKMENIVTVEELMELDDSSITFNLKHAYNHIPVHKSLQPLLGIGWKGKCYRFLGMPFSLSDAPRDFSLIMRKVERQIRELWGVKVVIHIDDIIVLHQDPKRLEEIGKELADYLKYFGWMVNLEKSHLVPSKIFTYLGWTLNSEDMTIQLTKERYKTCLLAARKTQRKA